MRITRKSERSGFTLIELLLVVAIIVLLISILLPGMGCARSMARQMICSSRMNQLLAAQLTYSTDNKNRIGALNWVPGANHGPPGLNPGPTASWLQAEGMQAADIVRRNRNYNIALTQNRFFNRNFWHLPLVDGGYFGGSSNPIQPAAGCPEDDWVLRWQKNEGNLAALAGTSPEPTAIPANTYEMYRPYWSTFQLVPVAWAPDKHVSGSRRTLSQITNRHHLFTGGGASPGQLPLGQRTIDEVAFSSQKVFIFDVFARHGCKTKILWHAYPNTRQPLAFFDGSVRFLRTGDAQRGWNPDAPTSPNPTTYTYTPSSGFPGYDHPTLSGAASDTVIGYYRWTRFGLRGVDYIADRPKGQ